MRKKEIIDTTKKLIEFRTTSDNICELNRCADFIENYFKGFYVRRFTKNNIPSLYICKKQNKKPKILLNAHADVVPGPNKLFNATVKRNKLFGRGAIDDKGPLAICMNLLKELKNPNLALLVTFDEEQGGFNGMKHVLASYKPKPGFVLVLDGGKLNTYIIKEKGLMQLKLTAKGRAAHGSRPWLGNNAIESLIDIYPKIKRLFPVKRKDHWEKSLNLGRFIAGGAVNIVPDKAEMYFDIRYTENDNPDKIIKDIKNIAKRKSIDVEVMFKEPLFVTDPNNNHLKQLIKISQRITKKRSTIAAEHGASDARHLTKTPAVITYPDGAGCHTDDEYLDISSIGAFYKIIKEFILQVS